MWLLKVQKTQSTEGKSVARLTSIRSIHICLPRVKTRGGCKIFHLVLHAKSAGTVKQVILVTHSMCCKSESRHVCSYYLFRRLGFLDFRLCKFCRSCLYPAVMPAGIEKVLVFTDFVFSQLVVRPTPRYSRVFRACYCI